MSTKHKLLKSETEAVSRRVSETKKEIERLKAEYQVLINHGLNKTDNKIQENDSLGIVIKNTSENLIEESDIPAQNNDKEVKIIQSKVKSNLNTAGRTNFSNTRSKPREILKEKSPKKNKNYDVEETREYIKKQKEKRIEEMKSKLKKSENTIEIRRQKLKELSKKSLQIVNKCVEKQRSRSKSRENNQQHLDAIENYIPVPDIITSSHVETPETSSRTSFKIRQNFDNITIRSPILENFDSIPLLRSKREPKYSLKHEKAAIIIQSFYKGFRQRKLYQHSLKMQRKLEENIRKIKMDQSNFNKIEICGSDSQNNSRRNKLETNKRQLIEDTSNNHSQTNDFESRTFKIQAQINSHATESDEEVNEIGSHVRRIVSQLNKTNNQLKSESEINKCWFTENERNKKECPPWLESGPQTYPYNFISTVKRKLNLAVNSPTKKTNDVGVQISPTSSHKTSKEIKDLIEKSVNLPNSFLQEKRAGDLDLKNVEGLKLKSHNTRSGLNESKNDFKVPKNDINSDNEIIYTIDFSDSDTSNNIPDISLESHATESFQKHSNKVSKNQSHNTLQSPNLRERNSSQAQSVVDDNFERSIVSSISERKSRIDKPRHSNVDDFILEINMDSLKKLKLQRNRKSYDELNNTMNSFQNIQVTPSISDNISEHLTSASESIESYTEISQPKSKFDKFQRQGIVKNDKNHTDNENINRKLLSGDSLSRNNASKTTATIETNVDSKNERTPTTKNEAARTSTTKNDHTRSSTTTNDQPRTSTSKNEEPRTSMIKNDQARSVSSIDDKVNNDTRSKSSVAEILDARNRIRSKSMKNLKVPDDDLKYSKHSYSTHDDSIISSNKSDYCKSKSGSSNNSAQNTIVKSRSETMLQEDDQLKSFRDYMDQLNISKLPQNHLVGAEIEDRTITKDVDTNLANVVEVLQNLESNARKTPSSESEISTQISLKSAPFTLKSAQSTPRSTDSTAKSGLKSVPSYNTMKSATPESYNTTSSKHMNLMKNKRHSDGDTYSSNFTSIISPLTVPVLNLETKKRMSLKAGEKGSVETSGNQNQIHVKFEAELHLLNDFNDHMKQFMSVEKSLLDLQNTLNTTKTTICESRDTQTSFITKTSTETKTSSVKNITEQIPSSLAASINYSRGSAMNEQRSMNQTYFANHSGDHSLANFDDSLLSTGLEISEIQDNTVDATFDYGATFDNATKSRNVHAGLSLGMFEQLIKDEDARIENLKTILKIREKALLDRTKGELAWLEVQKKHLLETGQLHEASLLKKKQRGIIIKLQHEKHEMQKLKQIQKAASKERKTILKEQRNMIKSQLSSNNMLTKIKRTPSKERRHSGPVKVYNYQRETLKSETSISRRSSVAEEILYTSCSESTVSRITDGAVSDGIQSLRDETNCVALKTIGSNTKTENAKKSLLMREAALQKRRKAAEDLLQWHHKLLEEERKITELEMAASNIINEVPSVTIENNSTNEKYRFKGAQLNLLWRNMTGREEKKFNDAENYSLSQIALERFCKDAKKTKNTAKMLARSDLARKEVALKKQMKDRETSSAKEISDLSEEKNAQDASISEKITSHVSEEIVTAPEDTSVLNTDIELEDGIKESKSTLNEIMQNISSITDEISELYKLSSVKESIKSQSFSKSSDLLIPTEENLISSHSEIDVRNSSNKLTENEEVLTNNEEIVTETNESKHIQEVLTENEELLTNNEEISSKSEETNDLTYDTGEVLRKNEELLINNKEIATETEETNRLIKNSSEVPTENEDLLTENQEILTDKPDVSTNIEDMLVTDKEITENQDLLTNDEKTDLQSSNMEESLSKIPSIPTDVQEDSAEIVSEKITNSTIEDPSEKSHSIDIEYGKIINHSNIEEINSEQIQGSNEISSIHADLEVSSTKLEHSQRTNNSNGISEALVQSEEEDNKHATESIISSKTLERSKETENEKIKPDSIEEILSLTYKDRENKSMIEEITSKSAHTSSNKLELKEETIQEEGSLKVLQNSVEQSEIEETDSRTNISSNFDESRTKKTNSITDERKKLKKQSVVSEVSLEQSNIEETASRTNISSNFDESSIKKTNSITDEHKKLENQSIVSEASLEQSKIEETASRTNISSNFDENSMKKTNSITDEHKKLENQSIVSKASLEQSKIEETASRTNISSNFDENSMKKTNSITDEHKKLENQSVVNEASLEQSKIEETASGTDISSNFEESSLKKTNSITDEHKKLENQSVISEVSSEITKSLPLSSNQSKSNTSKFEDSNVDHHDDTSNENQKPDLEEISGDSKLEKNVSITETTKTTSSALDLSYGRTHSRSIPTNSILEENSRADLSNNSDVKVIEEEEKNSLKENIQHDENISNDLDTFNKEINSLNEEGNLKGDEEIDDRCSFKKIKNDEETSEVEKSGSLLISELCPSKSLSINDDIQNGSQTDEEIDVSKFDNQLNILEDAENKVSDIHLENQMDNLEDDINNSKYTLNAIIQDINTISDDISELYKLSAIPKSVKPQSDKDLVGGADNQELIDDTQKSDIINKLNEDCDGNELPRSSEERSYDKITVDESKVIEEVIILAKDETDSPKSGEESKVIEKVQILAEDKNDSSKTVEDFDSEADKTDGNIDGIKDSPKKLQVDVKKRVSEILADSHIHEPKADSPRMQDLYCTTYDLISPEHSPESGSPVGSLSEKGLISAKALYEAEQLLKKQLAIEQEIKQLEQQQKEQLPYLYMREIPNKPPPPYKPPVKTLTPTPTTVLPSNIEQINAVTPKIAKILYRAQQKNDLIASVLPENITDKLIDRICYEFIFDVCKAMAVDHYKQFEKKSTISWMISNISKGIHRPLNEKGLQELFNKKLKDIFGFEKVEVKESMIIKWSRKKRDHVDELLVLELQAEEAEWTNYDQDELIVKDEVTNDIFNMLLAETAIVFDKIITKNMLNNV